MMKTTFVLLAGVSWFSLPLAIVVAESESLSCAVRHGAAAYPAPDGLNASDWQGIRDAYKAARHVMVQQADGTFTAHNPGQQWQATFDGRGFTVKPDSGGWEWGLELEGFGEVTNVRHEGGKRSCLRSGGLTDWFVNDARGLEQGWSLEKRPDRLNPDAPLLLHLRLRGDLTPQVAEEGVSIGFVNESGATALVYSGLKAWDGDGNIVQARFVDGELNPLSPSLRTAL